MKKKKKNKNKTAITLISIFLGIFLVLIFTGSIVNEYDKKPILKEKVESRNAEYLYNFYVTGTPNIEGRPYYGSENAVITVVMYLDSGSETSKYYFNEIYPNTLKNYVDEGRVKIYHKNYLTREDFEGKTERFKYAMQLICAERVLKNSYYDVLFGLQENEEIEKILQKKGIDLKDHSECMDSYESNEILEEISEIENFGMVGVNPRFYIGVMGIDNTVIDGIPTETRLRTTIRNYQTQIGD